MCKNKNDTSFEMSFSGAADRGRTGTDVTPTDFKCPFWVFMDFMPCNPLTKNGLIMRFLRY